MLITRANFNLYTWEQRMYAEIFRYTDMTMQKVFANMPEDAAQTLNFLMNNGLLTDLQKLAVRKYYIEGFTMEAISKEYGVSSTAVKNNCDSAMHRLRKNMDILLMGITKYNEQKVDDTPQPMLVVNMDISTRGINVLRTHGINTIDDLRTVTKAQLQNMKKVGPKTVDDIIDSVKKYGVEIR